MFCDGVEPTCQCGCGTSVKFHSLSRGMSKFAPGHQSRVNNNWGHNARALDNSHQTMREKRKQGECPAWNKGLTKEIDERVASYGKSQTKNLTDARRFRLSNKMRQQRLSGNIPTLYGPDSSQWKGGTSSLSAECHGDSRLYKEWKHPKLVEASFKCTRCGLTKDLCVHHDKERMSSIIHLMVEKFGYDATTSSHELKMQVINAITDYHVEHDVSGVVLCKVCHTKEHPNLNF